MYYVADFAYIQRKDGSRSHAVVLTLDAGIFTYGLILIYYHLCQLTEK